MKYEEIYKQMDDYLIRTSLKNYCATVCKGECCIEYGCKLFPHGCENKLACKIYLCGQVIHFLNTFFETKDFDFFLGPNVDKLMNPIKKSMFLKHQRDIYIGDYNTKNVSNYVFQKVISLPLKEERVEDMKKIFDFFTRVKIDRKGINGFDKKLLKSWAKIR